MTIRDIAEHLNDMCKEGLSPSTLIKMRKALRALSQDMRVSSAKYKKALDKSITIRVEHK